MDMLWPALMVTCVTNKETTDCKFCNSFTPEQRAQISTQSYKLKKEKREAKHLDNPPHLKTVP